MSDSAASSSTAGLHEVILTLPRPIVAGLAVLMVAGAIAAAWMATTSTTPSLQEVAKSVLLVLLPLLVIVIAAIGIRRTSTHQVDQLVTAFLEQTVLQRFQLACTHHEAHPYPFSEVALARRTFGRSYADFRLTADCPRCQQRPELPRPPPSTVWVKMNVINVEVGTTLRLAWPGALPPNALYDRQTIAPVFEHPLLRRLSMTIQGSVEEDYKVRVLFEPGGDGHVQAHLSFRQKLRDHFLGSPFLKRYYAEDAVILVGVLFHELLKAGLLPPARAADD